MKKPQILKVLKIRFITTNCKLLWIVEIHFRQESRLCSFKGWLKLGIITLVPYFGGWNKRSIGACSRIAFPSMQSEILETITNIAYSKSCSKMVSKHLCLDKIQLYVNHVTSKLHHIGILITNILFHTNAHVFILTNFHINLGCAIEFWILANSTLNRGFMGTKKLKGLIVENYRRLKHNEQSPNSSITIDVHLNVHQR